VPVFTAPASSTFRIPGAALADIVSAGSTYAPGFTTAQSVEVETFDSANPAIATNTSFHLAVLC
jgi:hypothetical protein